MDTQHAINNNAVSVPQSRAHVPSPSHPSLAVPDKKFMSTFRPSHPRVWAVGQTQLEEEEAGLVRDSEITSLQFANRHFPRVQGKYRVVDPTFQGSVLLAEQSSKYNLQSLQIYTMEISVLSSSVTISETC